MSYALILIFVLLWFTPGLAAELHVRQEVGGNCTSINQCVNQMSGGDTVIVHTGTYSEWDIRPPSGGGSWETATVVKAAPNESVTINCPSGCQGPLLGASNRSWIIFEGFTLQGNDRATHNALVDELAHHIRFVNITATGGRDSGFQAKSDPSDFNAFVEIINCNSINNGWAPTDPGVFGHGAYIATSSVTIDGGTWSNNAGHGAQAYRDPGSGQGVPNNIVVRNTRFHSNARVGLGLYHGGGHTVVNNIFYNGNGFRHLNVAATGLYAHNTLHGGDNGFYLAITSGSIVARNNIIYNNGTNWCIDTNGDGACESPGAGATVSSNLCNSTGLGCTHSGNPGFAGEAGGDFRIAEAGSPAVTIGAARLASVTTDFEGSGRNDPTAVGAYEFDGTVEPPQQPPIGKVGEWLFEANANSTAEVPESNPARFHHGTLVGNASIQAPGLVGAGKLVLDGNGDYVQITGHADLAPATEFVIFARVKPASLPGRQEIYSAGDSIGFFQEGGNLACFYYNGSSWAEVKTTTPVVAANTVQHVACGKTQGASGQADSLRIWHEASQVAFLGTTGTISYTLGPNVFIGQHGNGGGSYFNGDIDSVRFYANQRPTLMGIQNDFNELVPQLGRSVTDMAYMKANALEGQVLGLNTDLTHRLGGAIGLRFRVTKGSN